MRRRQRLTNQPGPTGRFPYGKIHEDDDEGEIKIGFAADRNTETVYIDFGTPVRSLGMRPEQAEALAALLLAKAMEARQ